MRPKHSLETGTLGGPLANRPTWDWAEGRAGAVCKVPQGAPQPRRGVVGASVAADPGRWVAEEPPLARAAPLPAGVACTSAAAASGVSVAPCLEMTADATRAAVRPMDTRSMCRR